MKKSIFCLAIILFTTILLSNLALAYNFEDFNDYSKLKLSINIKNSFNVISANPKINFISANLSYFPRSTGIQKVESLNKFATPQDSGGKEDKEYVPFFWQNPSAKNYQLIVESNVEVTNSIQTVNSKINFPIQPINTQYLKFTDLIDTNQDIKNKANELALGEDDLYQVAFKIGEWVEQNIKYDLSTLNANAVVKSTTVMEDRNGVCDELTNLYISMLRSIGIPARFISGTAYTNINHKWGPHAWAEVYFPDKGWVSFDVTYRQFGWIDPSHIVLKTGVDSGNSSIQYLWSGSNVGINVNKLDITTELVDLGPKITTNLINMKVKPLANNAGPSSYVPVEVTLENNQPFYVPEVITVTKAQKLEGSNTKAILLRPNEKTTIYWLMQIPKDLDPRYNYNTLFEIEDTFHKTSSVNISYSYSGSVFTKEKALNISATPEQEKNYNKDLKLECSNPEYVYSYENLEIKCTITNIGNVPHENIKVCLDKDCKIANLGIGEAAYPAYTLTNLQEGRRNLEIKATNSEFETAYRTSVNILNNPDLTISEFLYSEEMDFNTEYKLNGLVIVNAPVHDVKLFIDNKLIGGIPQLDSSKKVIIKVQGKDLIKETQFTLKATFKDKNEKEYTVEKTYPVKVQNIPVMIKILRWLFGNK